MIIYGKNVADEIKLELKKRILTFKKKPCLAVIQVGENPASNVYVRNKIKACEEVGITSITHRFKEDVSEEQLIKLIITMNNNEHINGILVQLPLPSHINVSKVIETIEPLKDVDGFHYMNIGKMFLEMDTMLPCTPFGVIKMLEYVGEDFVGKHAVIVGSSNNVGKPIATLLLNKGATITVCNNKTKDLAYHTKQADILIVAVGKEKLITKDMVKEGCTIIDVGINRNKEGKLCGDVDFENVKDIAKHISPVPKGVGVMTVTMLLYNTVEAYLKQNKED